MEASSGPKLNWKLWFWWTVATAAASVPFYFLPPSLPSARELFPKEAWGLDFLYMAAIGAGSGAITGVAQWLVLRRYIQKAWTWIVACTVGEAVGMIASWATLAGGSLAVLAWATAASSMFYSYDPSMVVRGIPGLILPGLVLALLIGPRPPVSTLPTDESSSSSLSR